MFIFLLFLISELLGDDIYVFQQVPRAINVTFSLGIPEIADSTSSSYDGPKTSTLSREEVSPFIDQAMVLKELRTRFIGLFRFSIVTSTCPAIELNGLLNFKDVVALLPLITAAYIGAGLSPSDGFLHPLFLALRYISSFKYLVSFRYLENSLRETILSFL